MDNNQNENPKTPIWMLIVIIILTVIIILAVLLQILLDINKPGLIPFATAGLFGVMGVSYFRSPKKDKTLFVILIGAFLLNIFSGILQLLNG